jgi:hypothetical protein
MTKKHVKIILKILVQNVHNSVKVGRFLLRNPRVKGRGSSTSKPTKSDNTNNQNNKLF